MHLCMDELASCKRIIAWWVPHSRLLGTQFLLLAPTLLCQYLTCQRGKVDLALTGPQPSEDYPRWWHSSAWNSDADFYQIIITRWIWYSTPGGMELLLNYATSVGPVLYDTRHMICSNNNIPVHDTLFFSFLFLSSPIHRLTLSLNPRWIVAGQESR